MLVGMTNEKRYWKEVGGVTTFTLAEKIAEGVTYNLTSSYGASGGKGWMPLTSDTEVGFSIYSTQLSDYEYTLDFSEAMYFTSLTISKININSFILYDATDGINEQIYTSSDSANGDITISLNRDIKTLVFVPIVATNSLTTKITIKLSSTIEADTTTITEGTPDDYTYIENVNEYYVPVDIDGKPLEIYDKSCIDDMLAYKEKAYTVAGTYSFIVPPLINRIRVAVCGAGGGCALVAEDDNDTHNNHTATDGTASVFGDNLLVATGGGGGNAQCNSSSAWGIGGTGGSPNGRDGSHGGGRGWTGTTVGGRGWALGFDGAEGDYGNGAYAYSKAGAGSSNAAGGGGGYTTAYFDVEPNATYTLTVGAFGANRKTYWEGGTTTFYDAKDGFVLIAYGGDIQR